MKRDNMIRYPLPFMLGDIFMIQIICALFLRKLLITKLSVHQWEEGGRAVETAGFSAKFKEHFYDTNHSYNVRAHLCTGFHRLCTNPYLQNLALKF